MPAEFRFSALDRSGRLITGTQQANSTEDLTQVLARRGQTLLHVSTTQSWLRTSRLSAAERTDITRELATMLGAGQDLDRALRFLRETTRGTAAQKILAALQAAVRDGAPLSTALEAHPDSFSRLYIGLTRAGEAGGTLAPTLERLAQLLERDRALTAAVQSALIYPALLLLAAGGAILLLLTTVLPQFVPLFQENGARLPASTRMLIGAGDAVSQFGLPALLVILAGALAARQILRQPGPRLAADRLLLRLPVVGGLAREVMAARLCRTLGSLLSNGVSLMAALAITRQVVGNRHGQAALEDATASAKSGAGLSRSLGESGAFPVRMVHLLRLGEETARLGEMALRAAEIHEEAARIRTQRMVSLLTPAITVVMGGVIAGIVTSLLLAMLSLNDLAQ